MRNCLVLGSGRSGTSMVTGVLAASGYFTGADSWEARDANPRGFHEDREVNSINEALLAPLTPLTLPGRLGQLVPGRLGAMQRWLALVDDGAQVRSTRSLDARMRRVLTRGPWALKDPRLCITLPAWRPHLGVDTVHVVVFRNPARTVASICREVEEARYLRNVRIDRTRAEALWRQAYRRVLRMSAEGGVWCFLDYDEIVDGDGLERLGTTLGCDLDGGFVDGALSRTGGAHDPVERATGRLYDRLRERAAVAGV